MCADIFGMAENIWRLICSAPSGVCPIVSASFAVPIPYSDASSTTFAVFRSIPAACWIGPYRSAPASNGARNSSSPDRFASVTGSI